MTIDQIRKAEKILARKEEELEAAKLQVKELKATKEKLSADLRRAIRGEEPELELQFVSVKTGEIVKDDEKKEKK